MTCAVTEVDSFEIIWRKYAKLHVFANPAGNSKGLGEKQKIRTGGGVKDYGNPRAWRGNAFWNFRRHWGIKIWKPSVGGYRCFLESPIPLFYFDSGFLFFFCYIFACLFFQVLKQIFTALNCKTTGSH